MTTYRPVAPGYRTGDPKLDAEQADRNAGIPEEFWPLTRAQQAQYERDKGTYEAEQEIDSGHRWPPAAASVVSLYRAKLINREQCLTMLRDMGIAIPEASPTPASPNRPDPFETTWGRRVKSWLQK